MHVYIISDFDNSQGKPKLGVVLKPHCARNRSTFLALSLYLMGYGVLVVHVVVAHSYMYMYMFGINRRPTLIAQNKRS